MKIERFDINYGWGDPVFLVEINSLDEFPSSYEWPTKHIRVLSIMDSSAMSRDEIMAFIDRLIDHRCTVFHAAGNDCHRVDCFYDHRQSHRNEANDIPSYPCFTVGHVDDSLEETMWSFLNVFDPYEEYEETTGTCVVVVNDDHEMANRVRDIFTGKDCDWMDRLDDIESQTRSPTRFINGVIKMILWPVRALGGRSSSDMDGGHPEDDQ